LNQQTFQDLHAEGWKQFERWLDGMTRQRVATPTPPTFADHEVAPRYRTLCQHLALARERQYSPALVERLNRLVIRGHQLLYGSHPRSGPAVLRFFTCDFARAVRAQWRLVALSALLFFGPLALLWTWTQTDPDVIHLIMPADQVAQYDQMYDAGNDTEHRSADQDTHMFGFYIGHNIRIGFQTFASGLLFGFGTAFYLVFNGLTIGATAGYLVGTGHGPIFLPFIVGHSAFELTGIVLMGAAGLMLGTALLFPGRTPRGMALRASARSALPRVYGAGALLVLAAVIEAFWSSSRMLPDTLKYAVGFALWGLVVAYFTIIGRSDAP
jgi:uncharacterized membrane protein SpoIIM required for sporulation